MKKVTSISRMQTLMKSAAANGEKIGFVPTMGFLHEGHMSLVKKSLKECSINVVSIFVNPLQFGPSEDFKKYPRDLKSDIRKLSEAGVAHVFIPDEKDFYPQPFLTTVDVSDISALGEGASRPTHFKGVTTVVAKLLLAVLPDNLYMGQKDIQQAVILKKMIADLNIPVKMKVCPIIREEDGLAMSSRNVYLSGPERKDALALYTSLQIGEKIIKSGERSVSKIQRAMEENFKKYARAELDYILFADGTSFFPVTCVENNTIVAIAGKVGKTRLIDNFIVKFKKQEIS